MGAGLTRLAPTWADWTPSASYTVGIEEEVMLLEPREFSLAPRIDDILPRLSAKLASSVTAETHGAALELATAPHPTAAGAAREAADLRAALVRELTRFDIHAASAGTHPLAMWTETRISSGARHQLVYDAMREIARREPTFAIHVHIGVSDRERAIVLYNRLRAHLPLLLALSVNSPFWQGRDTGLASTRTTVFQAFPRVGIPRPFASYADYVETVDLLLRCDAFPEPTFLWWDIRLQPRFGTVEVRIMDAQTTSAESAALAALVQSIAHLELEEGYQDERLIHAPEVLDENRFLAARDGMNARLIDMSAERRVPALDLLANLLDACRPHAEHLGCAPALERLADRDKDTGAERQRQAARDHGLSSQLVRALSDAFVE